MATKKSSTVILMDVSTASQRVCVQPEEPNADERRRLFIDEAKWVASRILLRKIFSTESDEVGVVVMGSNVTDCMMARRCTGSYENIEELVQVDLPTFDGVEAVMRLQPTKIDFVDWMAGLAAAASFLHESIGKRRFGIRQLVVMSPMATELEYDSQEVESVIAGINSLNVKVVFIGIDPKDSLFEDGALRLVRTAFDLFKEAIFLSWDEARETFKLFAKKEKALRFTKMPLQIGDKISIPMRQMKMNIDETRLKWSIVRPFNAEKPLLSDQSAPSNSNPAPPCQAPEAQAGGSRLKEDQSVEMKPVEEQKKPIEVRYTMDDCKVAVYGATEVLLSYADIEALKISTGPPSLRYIAAVPRKSITRSMLIPNDTYMLIPEANSRSKAIFSAFVDTLIEEDRFALARRIASQNGKVYLGALIPIRDDLGRALYFVRLPYAEYIRGVPQKDLPKETDPKLEEIITNIVDTMRLEVSGRDVLFKDPNFQLRSNLVTKAALGEPFASSLMLTDDDIDRLFNPTKELTAKARPFIEELQRLYPIQLPPPKTHRKKGQTEETVGKSAGNDVFLAPPPPLSSNDTGSSKASAPDSQSLQEALSDMEAYRTKVDGSQQNTEDLLADL